MCQLLTPSTVQQLLFVASLVIGITDAGSYEHMGTGHCEAGYYAGWNSADATLEACKARCTEEAQCLFFALKEAHTCSRYNSGAGDCSSVVGANDYELYRKLTAAPTTSAPTTASPTALGQLVHSSSLIINLQASAYDNPSETWTDLSSGYGSQGPSNGMMGLESSPPLSSSDGIAYFTFDGTKYVPLAAPFFPSANVLLKFSIGVYFRSTISGDAVTNCANFVNKPLLDFDRSEYFSLSFSHAGQLQFNTKSRIRHGMCTTTPLNVYNDNAWHYVTAVFDSSATPNKMLYMDGVLVLSATASNHTDGVGVTATLRYGFIGAGSEASSANGDRNVGEQVLEGSSIAMMHMYEGIALSASDVLANYMNITGTLPAWFF
ncbi:hypothetical protein CYMTET_26359 [Cymbomonas tetramitiformis]|uniref:Apple domain-containing protein n=1 Tax=Cymbomonas tetramitiformis TaxID=36881 RepID=A0AAE0FS16_9CHLO|nr:hypothetical protein CYMTET_26359 [Cymbomonas tetramitiformis]